MCRNILIDWLISSTHSQYIPAVNREIRENCALKYPGSNNCRDDRSHEIWYQWFIRIAIKELAMTLLESCWTVRGQKRCKWATTRSTQTEWVSLQLWWRVHHRPPPALFVVFHYCFARFRHDHWSSCVFVCVCARPCSRARAVLSYTRLKVSL